MGRLTRQRTAIQNLFDRADQPLRPQEVLALARRDVPALSLSTVYRTLRALVDDGALVTVEIPGVAALYEPAGLPHHHHFRCTVCSRVIDVTGDLELDSLTLPPGFVVTDHAVVLIGVCDHHA